MGTIDTERTPLIDIKHIALLLSGIIGAFAVFGCLAIPVEGDPDSPLRWFHLDRELTLAAFFSVVLLLSNCLLVFRLVRAEQLRSPALVLAAVFGFMGFDEGLKVHETLEHLVGFDWQILYLPIILIAGFGWAHLLPTRRGLTRSLWFGGAVSWIVSQLLEAGQWGWWTNELGKSDHYNILMVSEELLEMIGSALLLLALFKRSWPGGVTRLSGLELPLKASPPHNPPNPPAMVLDPIETHPEWDVFDVEE
ncbi:hypothetical protein ACFL3S_11885 [Gemmatimonadota bacterium]